MASSHDTGADGVFTIHREDFRAVLGPGAARHVLIETNAHEGPVYVGAEHALYFTTVPEPGPKNTAIMRLQLVGSAFPYAAGALDVVQYPSNMANGMTLGRDGRLVICEQGFGATGARISAMDLKTREVTTVVDRWRGLRLNSTNDVVIKRDGTVWFTDPNYGELQGFKGPSEVGAYVYRHDPATGETTVVSDAFNKPNGLVFSPDESVLYIDDSGANQEPGSYYPGLPHNVIAYDVQEGRRLRNPRLFAVVSPGVPDGIKVDMEGRVYVTSATGVQVYTPDGDLIGEIAAPKVANFTFGGPDNDVLFILGDDIIWQVKLQTRGASII